MFVTNGSNGVKCTGCGAGGVSTCSCRKSESMNVQIQNLPYGGIYSDNPGPHAYQQFNDGNGKFQPAGGSLGIPVWNWGDEQKADSAKADDDIVRNQGGGIGIPVWKW